MVTFKSYPGETVSLGGLTIANSSYLRFEGFRITGDVNIRDGADHIAFVGNHVPGNRVWLDGTSDVLIERNHIHDIPNGHSGGTIGIRLMGDVRTVVRGNTIENLVEDPIQVTEVRDVLIEGNTLRNAHPVSGQHTDTIQVLGCDGLVIRNNHATDIEHGLMFTNFQATNVTIENNLITNITGGMGMKAEGAYGMPNLRVINNTWWNIRYAVDFRTTHPNAIVRNNIFEKVTGLGDQPTAEYNLVPSGSNNGDHVIVATPSFTGNYELAAGSAGIDAGTSNNAPTTDRLGHTRRDDAGVANAGAGTPNYTDLGAHERQG